MGHFFPGFSPQISRALATPNSTPPSTEGSMLEPEPGGWKGVQVTWV